MRLPLTRGALPLHLPRIRTARRRRGRAMTEIEHRITEVLRETLPPFDGFEHQIAAAAARIVAELGFTQEFAACIEDEGQVWLVGNRRGLNPATVQRGAARYRDGFVGTAWTTRWERA
ncbi:hypothetical protein PBI_BIGNUZ_60 [Mycobacterium phage BigNuz]|uniref:Uncharacterized protein n=1 Tax=Mycobacterium phage BigNuz TaxID=1074309 RepID=G1JX75_9CAUD|nr:hypothetical protein PBI_BIGNUZ_60 [Mycobacterium phage BigNuz]AEL98222.1 hypothetical protein PBI_BIGNUZ_60 [Mycobacterium phage BigNuz]